MSKLGELALGVASKAYRKRYVRAHSGAAEEDFDRYFKWQFESSERLFRHYPDFDLTGKRVLEIGCGTGGRTNYLATLGAKEIVGIDINGPEIEIANRLTQKHFPENAGHLSFLHSKENEQIDSEDFDLVVMVDCLEHVVSPANILKLAKGYLKEGGKFYASCVGYYHYQGSHLTHYLPFINVVFSDETILNYIRKDVSRSEYIPTVYDSNPPVERWEGLYDLADRPGEHLNKITIKGLNKLVKYSTFRNAHLHTIGIQRQSGPLKLLKHASRVPYLKELLHSFNVVVCEK